MPSIQFENFSLELVLFFSSLLLVLSVLLSRISSSFGLPSLLLFLGLGMLAGSEGPGGIPFENYKVAFGVGSICLAFIIFDGGLRTHWSSVRPILRIGVSLSFFGTVITAMATGIFSHFVLGMEWPPSFLLGAIVSSTDAPAVFGILRSKGIGLKSELKSILEFEAGSNDPIAFFLTLAVLMFMTTGEMGGVGIVGLFLKQAGLGLSLGWFGAKFFRWLINKTGIEYEGLYGVLMIGLVVLLFSATLAIGGSGFLAVYIAGLVLGNSEFIHKSTVVRFLDGIAWISQIIIFLALGLLVFPVKLMEFWKEGLALALFMILVARPISVFASIPSRSLSGRSRIFISWIGLRGAAPIILATLPWSMGLDNAEYFFNLVFFVVLISVVVQGISIPWVSKKLNVTAILQRESTTSLASPLPSGFVMFEADVSKETSACNRRVVELGLPQGVLLTSIERDGKYEVPQGRSILMAADRIRGFARESNLKDLEKLFGSVLKV